MEENEGIVQHAFHPLRVGHEVRGQVAAVELHALHHLQGGFDRLGFLDRDDSVLADLGHGLGNDGADGGIPVGGNRADLGDRPSLHRHGQAANFVHGLRYRLIDAALQSHRIGSGSNGLDPFPENRLSQNRSRGRPVSRHVAGLGSHFPHHLGSHVLFDVLEFDLFGDGDAVLGNGRRPEFLVQNDIPSLGTQGDANRVGQLIDTLQDGLTGIFTVSNSLCHASFLHVFRGLIFRGRIGLGGRHGLLACVRKDTEDLVFPQDEVFLTFNLDVGARIFAE